MIDQFDGIFAMIIFDERSGHYTVARDAMGICPLYWGRGADGSYWFASEMKALHDVCENFDIFPPVRSLSETLVISAISGRPLSPLVRPTWADARSLCLTICVGETSQLHLMTSRCFPNR
jgi:asparagine synthetase B (glutamine-hydrolysing)